MWRIPKITIREDVKFACYADFAAVYQHYCEELHNEPIDEWQPGCFLPEPDSHMQVPIPQPWYEALQDMTNKQYPQYYVPWLIPVSTFRSLFWQIMSPMNDTPTLFDIGNRTPMLPQGLCLTIEVVLDLAESLNHGRQLRSHNKGLLL